MPFRDPARVRLEDREHLLVLRDRLALEKTAVDLVNLTLRMRDIPFDLHDFPGFHTMCDQIPQGSPPHARQARGQRPRYASTCSGRARRVTRTLWNNRRTSRVRCFHWRQPRTPALRRRTAHRPDQAAHRVPQKTDIRRIVNVGLDHEAVTAPDQGRARLFSRDRMAALHNQIIDRNKQFGAQKAHIVHQPLVAVAIIVPDIPMAKEAAQRLVLVHKLVETVEIAAQTLLDHPHHEDPPHLHARPSDLPVDAGKDVLVQECEQPGAEMLVGVEMLKSQQQGRDVVPGLEVEFDVFDVNLAECHLRIAYLSHPCLAKKCAHRPGLGQKGLKTAFQP